MVEEFGAVLIEAAGEYEYRDGLFYITYMAGERKLRACMRPHTFLRCIEGARRALAVRDAQPGNVVELRRAEHC